MSTLCFIFMLLILLVIPALTYTFIFLLRCPPNPFHPSSAERPPQRAAVGSCKVGGARMEPVTIVVAKLDKAKEEARGDGDGGGDCPVCLAAFEDGEELWQLSLCKHLFHGPCVERWLHVHSNCPVCRAYVTVPKPSAQPKRSLVVPAAARVMGATRGDDLWQGLPDSAGLV